MGYRFYTQQLEATGTCPGAPLTNRRKRKMAWTDEQKAQAVAMYLEAEPTPENSTEIVASIAEELEQSPNGVRMILSTRVSKAAAIEQLTAAISDSGADVDEEILAKLTGKAAMYFTGVLNHVNAA
jgi:transposase-like protein